MIVAWARQVQVDFGVFSSITNRLVDNDNTCLCLVVSMEHVGMRAG